MCHNFAPHEQCQFQCQTGSGVHNKCSAEDTCVQIDYKEVIRIRFPTRTSISHIFAVDLENKFKETIFRGYASPANQHHTWRRWEVQIDGASSGRSGPEHGRYRMCSGAWLRSTLLNGSFPKILASSLCYQ